MGNALYRCPECRDSHGFTIAGLAACLTLTLDRWGNAIDHDVVTPYEWSDVDIMTCRTCSHRALVRHFRIRGVLPGPADRPPADPITALSAGDARERLKEIREILWPPSDPEEQWSPDTLDAIAEVLVDLEPSLRDPHDPNTT